ncbi:MAG TPA: hypothetical protein VFH09_00270 [Nitrososphaera sp.]|nr:hypothetical protein [Nitrososphaera sp.]
MALAEVERHLLRVQSIVSPIFLDEFKLHDKVCPAATYIASKMRLVMHPAPPLSGDQWQLIDKRVFDAYMPPVNNTPALCEMNNREMPKKMQLLLLLLLARRRVESSWTPSLELALQAL